MLIFTVIFCLAGIASLGRSVWVSRRTRRDETRMASYIASLKAVAAGQRARIAELERALGERDDLLAAQDRLLDGQAAHLRSLDPRYVG